MEVTDDFEDDHSRNGDASNHNGSESHILTLDDIAGAETESPDMSLDGDERLYSMAETRVSKPSEATRSVNRQSEFQDELGATGSGAWGPSSGILRAGQGDDTPRRRTYMSIDASTDNYDHRSGHADHVVAPMLPNLEKRPGPKQQPGHLAGTAGERSSGRAHAGSPIAFSSTTPAAIVPIGASSIRMGSSRSSTAGGMFRGSATMTGSALGAPTDAAIAPLAGVSRSGMQTGGDLRTLIEQKEKELHDITEYRARHLQAQLEKTQSDLSALRDHHQRLRADFAHNLQLLSGRDEDLDRLEGEVQRARSAAEGTQRALTESDSRRLEAEEALARNRHHAAEAEQALEGRLRQAREAVAQAKAEAEAEHVRMQSRLDAALREAESRSAEDRDVMARERRELQEAAHSAAEERENRHRQAVAQLQEELAKSQARCKELEHGQRVTRDETEAMRKELDKTSQQLRESVGAREAAVRQLQELRGDHDRAVKEASTQEDRSQEERRQLMAEYERRLEGMVGQLRGVEAALAEARELAHGRALELESALQQLRGAEARARSAEEQASEARMVQSRSTGEAEELRRSAEEAVESLSLAVRQRDEAKQRAERAHEELTAAASRAGELERGLEAARQETERVREAAKRSDEAKEQAVVARERAEAGRADAEASRKLMEGERDSAKGRLKETEEELQQAKEIIDRHAQAADAVRRARDGVTVAAGRLASAGATMRPTLGNGRQGYGGGDAGLLTPGNGRGGDSGFGYGRDASPAFTDDQGPVSPLPSMTQGLDAAATPGVSVLVDQGAAMAAPEPVGFDPSQMRAVEAATNFHQEEDESDAHGVEGLGGGVVLSPVRGGEGGIAAADAGFRAPSDHGKGDELVPGLASSTHRENENQLRRRAVELEEQSHRFRSVIRDMRQQIEELQEQQQQQQQQTSSDDAAESTRKAIEAATGSAASAQQTAVEAEEQVDRAGRLVDVLRERIRSLETKQGRPSTPSAGTSSDSDLPDEVEQLQSMVRGSRQEVECLRETGQFLQKVVRQLRERLREQERRAMDASRAASVAQSSLASNTVRASSSNQGPSPGEWSRDISQAEEGTGVEARSPVRQSVGGLQVALAAATSDLARLARERDALIDGGNRMRAQLRRLQEESARSLHGNGDWKLHIQQQQQQQQRLAMGSIPASAAPLVPYGVAPPTLPHNSHLSASSFKTPIASAPSQSQNTMQEQDQDQSHEQRSEMTGFGGLVVAVEAKETRAGGNTTVSLAAVEEALVRLSEQQRRMRREVRKLSGRGGDGEHDGGGGGGGGSSSARASTIGSIGSRHSGHSSHRSAIRRGPEGTRSRGGRGDAPEVEVRGRGMEGVGSPLGGGTREPSGHQSKSSHREQSLTHEGRVTSRQRHRDGVGADDGDVGDRDRRQHGRARQRGGGSTHMDALEAGAETQDSRKISSVRRAAERSALHGGVAMAAGVSNPDLDAEGGGRPPRGGVASRGSRRDRHRQSFSGSTDVATGQSSVQNSTTGSRIRHYGVDVARRKAQGLEQ